jgi:hypothetical protein
MDLSSLGFNVACIAGINGVVLALKSLFNNNQKLKFLNDYILLFVVGFGIVAGFGSSFVNDKLIIGSIINNILTYAGGAVLFHQLYKQFLGGKQENVKKG